MSSNNADDLSYAPQSINYVTVLGSWDNFRKPYPMKRDCRMGRGHWRGCHSFTDIICDGDCLKAEGGRDGGLKMGGTYWYYYELNGSIEYHNPAEPSITSCPFLPGQTVNVLEVPIQIQEHNSRSPSASTSSLTSTYHYTLNPEDKYVNPAPPTSPIPYKSKIFAASADNLSQENQLERVKPIPLEPVKEGSISNRRASSSCYDLPSNDYGVSLPRSEPMSRQSSIWATFGELRSVRSAGHALRMGFDFGFERPTTSAGRPMEPIGRDSLVSTPRRPLSDAHDPVCEPATVGVDLRPVYEPFEFPEDIPQIDKRSSDVRLRSTYALLPGPQQSYDSTSELLSVFEKSRPSRSQVNDLASQFSLTLVGDNITDSRQFNPMDTESSFDHSETGDRVCGLPDDIIGPVQEKYHQTSSVYSSVRSSQVISPSLTFSTALTGYMSPVHLGQPSTPMIDEFEESFFDLKLDSLLARCDEQPEDEAITHRANNRGFPGYNLPDVENLSALTLRNLQSTTPKDSPSKKKSSHDLVSSWNDGLTAPETGQEELLDELGYLGEVIV
ncbi:hypothetical protein MMC30_008006 [Trapelia coarctata]|nr:hypothetical protein [Trapelia coarctata]